MEDRAQVIEHHIIRIRIVVATRRHADVQCFHIQNTQRFVDAHLAILLVAMVVAVRDTRIALLFSTNIVLVRVVIVSGKNDIVIGILARSMDDCLASNLGDSTRVIMLVQMDVARAVRVIHSRI